MASPAALEDRCCHRAAPLSLGAVEGDHLRCGYHGLTFDAKGQCVSVPGQDSVPSGARVRAYPVAERYNVVWIWMGDPARADDSKIVELPWLADTGLDADARLHAHRCERAAPGRQPARLHPRRPSAYEHHFRRSARGDHADQDRTPERRRARRPLDDRFQAAAVVRQGRRLRRQCRPLAARDLAAAEHRLHGRRRRQDRHRRAGGRPQPGHLDLVDASGDAGIRDHLSLSLRLCAQLPARRCGDVEAPV